MSSRGRSRSCSKMVDWSIRAAPMLFLEKLASLIEDEGAEGGAVGVRVPHHKNPHHKNPHHKNPLPPLLSNLRGRTPLPIRAKKSNESTTTPGFRSIPSIDSSTLFVLCWAVENLRTMKWVPLLNRFRPNIAPAPSSEPIVPTPSPRKRNRPNPGGHPRADRADKKALAGKRCPAVGPVQALLPDRVQRAEPAPEEDLVAEKNPVEKSPRPPRQPPVTRPIRRNAAGGAEESQPVASRAVTSGDRVARVIPGQRRVLALPQQERRETEPRRSDGGVDVGASPVEPSPLDRAQARHRGTRPAVRFGRISQPSGASVSVTGNRS
jgi:hypothetical protein